MLPSSQSTATTPMTVYQEVVSVASQTTSLLACSWQPLCRTCPSKAFAIGMGSVVEQQQLQHVALGYVRHVGSGNRDANTSLQQQEPMLREPIRLHRHQLCLCPTQDSRLAGKCFHLPSSGYLALAFRH